MLFRSPIPTSLPHVKSGKLRALAISTLKRSPTLPDLPTVAESGVAGFESSLWYGALLPAATPTAIASKLNRAINDALRVPDLGERFAALGAEPTGGTAAAFRAYIAEEMVKWGKVIKAAGIKSE